MTITSNEIRVKVDEVKNNIAEAYDDYLQKQVRIDYDRESSRIVSDFVSWLDQEISPDYEMPDEDEVYDFVNGIISAPELAKKVKDIKGFSEEILSSIDLDSDAHRHNCEVILGGLFTPSLLAVELTELIQENSSGDIKSDLTEEFAWLFDYIRNVASDEKNANYINILKKELNQLPRKTKQAKNEAIMKVLQTVKKDIADNQSNYGIHNPFGGKYFEKATGGLPDVVSAYTESDLEDSDGKNMLNFTAANSLTDLSMESDQLERHGCMLALAIYRNDGRVDANIGEHINDSVGDPTLYRNAKSQRVLVDAISGKFESGDKEVINVLEGLGLAVDDLPKIKAILNEKVNITFFQTYSVKTPSPEIMDGVLNSLGSEGNVDAKKELYREINQWDSYFLGNSQTIFNRSLDRNRPEIIDSMTTNQNNKSTPLSGAKVVSTHAVEMRDFINDKFINQGLVSDFLEKLAKPNDMDSADKEDVYWKDYYDSISLESASAKQAEKFFKPATKYMRKKIEEEGGESELRRFDEQEKKKLQFLEYSSGKIDNWKESGDSSPAITGNLGKIQGLYKTSRASTVTSLSEYDDELLNGAGPIELSMISMMSSSDIMKESLLQNIFDILETDFNKTDDLKLKEELMNQMNGIKEYAEKVLNNRGGRAGNLSNIYYNKNIKDVYESAANISTMGSKIEEQSGKIDSLEEENRALLAKLKRMESQGRVQ